MSLIPHEKDLLGARLLARRPIYSCLLERDDRNSFEARRERLEHFRKVFSRGLTFLMPLESHAVFSEIQTAYIAGLTVSVVLLCQAFIEHCYQGRLAAAGYEKAAKGGLAAIIKTTRTHDLEHPIVLERVDALRKIRNPFVHLQEPDHPDNLGRRMVEHGYSPGGTLDLDAKRALEAFFAVIQHTKFQS